MKVTKEMLAELRAALKLTTRDGKVQVSPEVLHAVIEERKALRAELRAVYMRPDPGDRFSLALALGEDE